MTTSPLYTTFPVPIPTGRAGHHNTARVSGSIPTGPTHAKDVRPHSVFGQKRPPIGMVLFIFLIHLYIHTQKKT